MSDVTAAGQDGDASAQFEFEERPLQHRAPHFGAGGEDFKGGRRVAERVQDARRLRR
jgi:hypothetical protein